MICTPHKILFERSRRMQHVQGGEVYTGFWWENLKERDHLQDPSVDERIILR